MTTIAVSNDFISKLSNMKIEDATSDEPMMHRVVNIIAFDNEVTQEDKDISEKAGITVYTME
jgi:hypothetical protein